MIGICPYTGKTVQGLKQLIARVERLTRTVITTRPKHRAYGTEIRGYLGKNNSRVIITKLQNLILTELSIPANGLTDFKCDQVKVLADGKIYIIGAFNGERINFSI